MEQLYGVAVLPLIMGMIALLKSVIEEEYHKYMGLVAWGLGLSIGITHGMLEGWQGLQCIIVGSALGLSAAGFYSTQKNARE